MGNLPPVSTQTVNLDWLRLGLRSPRYAMTVEDYTVTPFDLDKPVEIAEQTKRGDLGQTLERLKAVRQALITFYYLPI